MKQYSYPYHWVGRAPDFHFEGRVLESRLGQLLTLTPKLLCISDWSEEMVSVLQRARKTEIWTIHETAVNPTETTKKIEKTNKQKQQLQKQQ